MRRVSVLCCVASIMFVIIVIRSKRARSKLVVQSNVRRVVHHALPQTAPVTAFTLPTCVSVLQDLRQKVLNSLGHEKFQWLTDLGDAYARGCYPMYAPHRTAALNCYRVAAMAPYPLTAATAMSKLVQMQQYPLQTVDIAMNAPALPADIAHACYAHCQNIVDHVQRQRKRQQQEQEQQTRHTTPMHGHEVTAQIAVEQAAPLYAHRVDLQNVHDSAVVAGVTTTLRNLQRSSGRRDSISTTQQVRESIQFSADITPAELQAADRVLTSLNDARHGTFGASETEALDLVWNKVQSIDDPDLRSNLIEQLGKQLATGVERDNVVCSTGRIARIVSVLDTVENQAPIRSLETVKEELSTLAAKIRSDHLATAEPQQIQNYNEGTSTALADRMKSNFQDAAIKTYVDDLNMHAAVLQPIIDAYAEAL